MNIHEITEKHGLEGYTYNPPILNKFKFFKSLYTLICSTVNRIIVTIGYIGCIMK